MVVGRFLTLVGNWLNVKIHIFHYSNKQSVGNEVEFMSENKDCTTEYAPPSLLGTRGPAERLGGMIVRTDQAQKSATKLLWLYGFLVYSIFEDHQAGAARQDVTRRRDRIFG